MTPQHDGTVHSTKLNAGKCKSIDAPTNPTKAKSIHYQIGSEFIQRGLADAIINALYVDQGCRNSVYYDVSNKEFSMDTKHRYALAILLLSFYLELKPHKNNEGWQALSFNRLRRLFRADDKFIEVLRGDVFFENDHNFSILENTCKSARLFKEDIGLIEMVVHNYSKSPVEPELVNYRGEPFEPLHIGLPRYGKSEPLKISNIAKSIQISGYALTAALVYIQKWISSGPNNPHPDNDLPRLTEVLEAKRAEYQNSKTNPDNAFNNYLRTVCKQVEYLLVFADTGLPIPIQMSTSGRLYGPYLQRCHRVVRELALHGLWCFDFSACHHRILQHEARRYGLACPYLDEYLVDKSIYRKALANDIGSTKEQTKEALIALAYGAGIKRNKVYGKPAAIAKILGDDVFKKIKHTARFQGLADELKIITNVMYDNARKKNGQLLNAMWLPIQIEGLDKAALTAHLLQGIEAQLTNAAIRAHNLGSKKGKEVVVLPLFDGWLTRIERDPMVARTAAFNKTGIEIEVECKRYELID